MSLIGEALSLMHLLL